ncbi:hypothetical protein ACKOZB_004606 [Vibrio parahaemolyticus]
MIPKFEESGVLPPFVGDGPTKPANQAPYKVSLEAFVEHFATVRKELKFFWAFFNTVRSLKA